MKKTKMKNEKEFVWNGLKIKTMNGLKIKNVVGHDGKLYTSFYGIVVELVEVYQDEEDYEKLKKIMELLKD